MHFHPALGTYHSSFSLPKFRFLVWFLTIELQAFLQIQDSKKTNVTQKKDIQYVIAYRKSHKKNQYIAHSLSLLYYLAP